MSATGTYSCTRCPEDAKPLRAEVDSVLALLGLCADHQAIRFAAGIKAQRESKTTPAQPARNDGRPGA